MKKIALFAGALALAGTPVLAQSLPAIAPVADESELEGSSGLLIAALAAGIIAIAVLAVTNDDDGENLPTSP